MLKKTPLLEERGMFRLAYNQELDLLCGLVILR